MVGGNSRKTWWNQNQHLLAVTGEILQNHLVQVLHQPKHQRENTICSRIFPRIQIVKYASARKLREQLADEIHKVTYTARPSSDTYSQPITKSSMKKDNCGTIKGMQLLYKIWPLNGFNSYPCKANTSEETATILRKFLDPEENPKVKFHRQLIFIRKSL